jgi:hypothetical protein
MTTDILNSLSLARTALDEGYAYDGVNDTDLSPEEMKLYVIEKIDDIIFALDPESPARALSTLGRMMADVVGEAPPDDDEEENVVRLIQEALDLVDRAIAILEPDDS